MMLISVGFLPDIIAFVACRHRHLMLDLTQLLPHSKKDAKLDTKTETAILNEVADMKVED